METILIGHRRNFVRFEMPVNRHALRLQIGSSFASQGIDFFRVANSGVWKREAVQVVPLRIIFLSGKQGQMLKKIGTAARLEIERMVGTKVFLQLFVKVRAGWRESRAFVEELDWRRQLEHLVSPKT